MHTRYNGANKSRARTRTGKPHFYAGHLLIIIIIGLYMQSCQLIYPAEGDTVIEEITVGKITTLIINDVFNVYITPDSTNRLAIECGENQIKTIKAIYDSTNHKLTLDNTVRIRGVQGYKPINVNLHTNVLTEIIVEQAAGIYLTDTLHVSNFLLTHNGDMGDCNLILNTERIEITMNDNAGKYIFSGRTNRLFIYNRGMSVVDAKELQALEIECIQLSAGNCYLSAKEKLIWKIYRNGNIFQNGTVGFAQGERYGKGELYFANQ